MLCNEFIKSQCINCCILIYFCRNKEKKSVLCAVELNDLGTIFKSREFLDPITGTIKTDLPKPPYYASGNVSILTSFVQAIIKFEVCFTHDILEVKELPSCLVWFPGRIILHGICIAWTHFGFTTCIWEHASVSYSTYCCSFSSQNTDFYCVM